MRKVICVINREGICQKSDNDIIRGALFSKSRQLERMLERNNLSPNERKMLRDEYERTFALTEKFGR
ncbi:hypothetical protein [Enterococcus bulliens]